MKIWKHTGKEIILPFYHCEMISKSVRPYEISIDEIIPKNSIESIYIKTNRGKHSLMIEWLFQIEDPFERWKMVHKFSNELQKVMIQFDNECEFYEAYLKSVDYDAINYDFKIVKMEFYCDITSPMKSVYLRNLSNIVQIDGARKTYISYEVTAKVDLENLKINDLIIKSLKKGEMIKIDSDKKIVIRNDISDFKNVEFTQFPEALGNYEVKVSDKDAAMIKIMYKARW